LDAPAAEVQGLPSAVSDENVDLIDEKARIRELRARFAVAVAVSPRSRRDYSTKKPKYRPNQQRGRANLVVSRRNQRGSSLKKVVYRPEERLF
jgi:hypothetical protein